MPMPRKPRRKCRFCEKECKRPQDFYCSNQCQRKYEWAERKRKFEIAGKFEGANNQTSLSRSYKKYLLEKRPRCCDVCKMDTWMGQNIPLVLDHADGNPNNWDLSNLRLICPNCDAQSPTFAGRNRGNGRAYRRDIYKRLGYC